jgi:hypothetical protein
MRTVIYRDNFTGVSGNNVDLGGITGQIVFANRPVKVTRVIIYLWVRNATGAGKYVSYFFTLTCTTDSINRVQLSGGNPLSNLPFSIRRGGDSAKYNEHNCEIPLSAGQGIGVTSFIIDSAIVVTDVIDMAIEFEWK